MARHRSSRLVVDASSASVGLGQGLVLLLAGVAQSWSLAWPFHDGWQGQPQGWLQILSLAFLAACVDRSRNPLQAFYQGVVFASAWLIGSTWWLFISMNLYGGMPAGLAALAVVLLGTSLALFYAIALWAYRTWCVQGMGVWSRASAFAVLWVLAEWLRGTLFTGFPWGAIGYAHVDSVLHHAVSWIGVYGLCGLAAWLAMAIAAQRQDRREVPLGWMARGVSVVALAALGLVWFGASRQAASEQAPPRPALTVTLLQGNVAQDIKFGAGVGRALTDYRAALLSNTSDLIVLPETALPVLPEQLPGSYWTELQQRYARSQQVALIGLPLSLSGSDGTRRYTNSALALQAGDAHSAYRYDKHHLVPFGEFVPPMFQWFVRLMNIPLGDFARGAVAQPSLVWRGERIAPNICYEDLFGEELAQSFADPATAPTLLLNLSNIAWFGDTVAIDQHLQISRMRTLELARPMLRATNTGATAIINARGEVTHRLPSGVQAALTASVQGVEGPVTPYARWVSAWGLWPLVALCLGVFVVVAWQSSQRRHGQRRFGP
jgi:apolipoprotein N-acyltransferase